MEKMLQGAIWKEKTPLGSSRLCGILCGDNPRRRRTGTSDTESSSQEASMWWILTTKTMPSFMDMTGFGRHL